MKKVLAFFAVAVLLVTFSAGAFAVGSPVAPMAPAAVQYTAPIKYGIIKITPVADAQKGTSEVDNSVVKAYDNIKDAKSLTALIPGLKEVVAGVDSKLNADELVVHDIFGISVVVDGVETTFVNGDKVTFSVKSDLKPGDVLVVAQFIDGNWVVLHTKDAVINDDDTVTLTVSSTVPTAFLTKAA